MRCGIERDLAAVVGREISAAHRKKGVSRLVKSQRKNEHHIPDGAEQQIVQSGLQAEGEKEKGGRRKAKGAGDDLGEPDEARSINDGSGGTIAELEDRSSPHSARDPHFNALARGC